MTKVIVEQPRLANQSLKLGFRDWGGNPPEHGNIFLKHRCSMIVIIFFGEGPKSMSPVSQDAIG